MNWKIVATLIVGAVLMSACGSAQQEAAAPSDEKRGAQEDPAPGGGSAIKPATATDTQPAMAPTDPAAAKKPIIVHDAAKP